MKVTTKGEIISPEGEGVEVYTHGFDDENKLLMTIEENLTEEGEITGCNITLPNGYTMYAYTMISKQFSTHEVLIGFYDNIPQTIIMTEQ